MATLTIRVDDLDGTKQTDDTPVAAIPFAFTNPETNELTMYTIDLTKTNAAKFVKAIAPYIAKATVVTMPTTRARSDRDRSESNKIREWAAKQINNDGTPRWDLAEKGRIPDEVRSAYSAANPPNANATEQPSTTEPTDTSKSAPTDNGASSGGDA